MVITSRQNEKIKFYNKLKKDKKEREKTNLICLEGLRLVTDCVEGGIKVKEIFITKNCYKKNVEKLRCLEGQEVNFIDEGLKEYLSDVANSQGIFSIASNPISPIEMFKPLTEKNYIALNKVNDPGNLGTIIRSAAALNFSGVFINKCCDPFSPKSIRSSMGAIFKIPIYICEDLESFLDICNRTITSYATVVKNNDILATHDDFKSGILLIGGEADGLDESIIKIAKLRIKIPLNKKIESFNASAAASICMYEMMKKTT